ncbi:hypothetical protein B0675_02025 [Streptomyces sp. M41(2017)]|nr:hypothetical protein B0675_02025 [Streptomyces sp. M41(2017)]
MCVRVRFSSRATPRLFDPSTRTITLPASVSRVHTVTAVRAVLAQLAVVQPELGAVCWCGEPVNLLPRVPQQRRNEQVIKHGA